MCVTPTFDSETVRRLRQSPGARYFVASLAALAIDYVITLALYYFAHLDLSVSAAIAFLALGAAQARALIESGVSAREIAVLSGDDLRQIARALDPISRGTTPRGRRSQRTNPGRPLERTEPCRHEEGPGAR